MIPPKVEEPSGPTKEDIAKVIEEHKQQEARRLERSKEKDQDGKDGKTDDKDNQDPKKKAAVPIPLPIDVTGSSATPKHRQFVLHRGIFSMLEREARSREQGAKAKEVGKGLLPPCYDGWSPAKLSYLYRSSSSPERSILI